MGDASENHPDNKPLTKQVIFEENDRNSMAEHERDNSCDNEDKNLQVPAQAENPIYVGRRCSDRLLSVGVRQALRHLKEREHKSRVAALVQKNANFYRKQRWFECAFLFSLLSMFSILSVYVLFAYGLSHLQRKGSTDSDSSNESFQLTMFTNTINQESRALDYNKKDKILRRQLKVKFNESVEMVCQVNHEWEWCRWIHLDRYCDFEWLSSSEVKPHQLNCDFPSDKVKFKGEMKEKNQCGLKVNNLQERDKGVWLCEVEKFYTGFSRRYGELAIGIFNINLESRYTKQKDTTFLYDQLHEKTQHAKFGEEDIIEERITMKQDEKGTTSVGEGGEVEEEEGGMEEGEDYKDEITEAKRYYMNKFFILKICVIGGITIVLTVLFILFIVYFMYLWRNDNKRRHPTRNSQDDIHAAEEAEFDRIYGPHSSDEDEEDLEEGDEG